MDSQRDKDIKQRKDLNADTLFSSIHSSFENFKDHRSEKAQIPLADAYMSAFAMFLLKDPSLLVFEARRSDRFRCKNNFTAFLGYNYCFLYHY